VREGEDEVIGGADRDAKETGHDRRPSSSGRNGLEAVADSAASWPKDGVSSGRL
jgi:hypothetical protein